MDQAHVLLFAAAAENTRHIDVLLFLLIDLVIIILAARSFGWLARQCGQAAVIGEIVAGISLGPTVLGRLFPGLPGESLPLPERLFPSAVPLHSIADLGLVFFMFLVGLELDPRLIAREGRRAFTISLSGLAAPLLLGILIALPLAPINDGGDFKGVSRPTSELAFPLFLGAALCITAFPVLARILVERGLYKTGLGTAALCAAAVDDVFAWILLAAVVGITRTGSAAAAGITFAYTLLFVVFMATAGRWLLNLLVRRYEAVGQLTADQVAVVLTGVLLSAYMTELIGIHAIFGGFVFGAVMPKQSRMTHELTDKVEDFTVVVLLPVFFCVAGLRTNLFALDSVELLGWLALILAVAIAGKLFGCGLAAKLNGFSWHDSIIIGSLMNTRGLTELVILTIGQSLGVLSEATFAMMVIMALVTTFMAAPIVNYLIPRKRMVAMLAGGEPAPVAMRVMVALGNPLNARNLVDAALRITGKLRPAELLLVRLIPSPRAPEFRTGLQDEESQVDASIDAMRELVRMAEEYGVKARAVSFLSDAVGPDFLHIAETQHCNAILLGWHRPSLARHIIRANTHLLFQEAPGDVVVFVDRKGEGMLLAAEPPALQPDLVEMPLQAEPAQFKVLVVQTGNDNDAAAMEVAQHLAENLSFAGSLASSSRSSIRIGQRLPENLKCAITPLTGAHAVSKAMAESSRVTAIVIGVGPDWAEGDFGQLASKLTEEADCPVFVVRGRPKKSG
jgi:Kef-type K+ transport system membrane component KefB/nucleotide-binding universal stress UspA family protein